MNFTHRAPFARHALIRITLHNVPKLQSILKGAADEARPPCSRLAQSGCKRDQPDHPLASGRRPAALLTGPKGIKIDG
ncbi:hypothetical protein [Ensifer sp. B1-9]|uniref:hypothetical protein n=1 Tax=Ensifer sp. B1-9 TaxID=3141455 RepID=UPI003D1EE6C9